MVIKKPYGFLIKHFKLIHFLLLIPMLYIALKFGDISKFFNDYVSAQYTTVETVIAGNYITVLTYLALFTMIISYGTISFLLTSKKKEAKFYLIGVGYYSLLIVCTILFYSTMSAIETSTTGSTFVNFVKDISKTVVFPSYILMIINILNGIGFNFKTMRFDKNSDLRITDEDEEEIEVKIDRDSYKTKKNIIHTIRELKYYFLENKFVFSCLGVVLGLIILVALYMEVEVYNKRYNVNQNFALDTFTMTLKESYLTTTDYGGHTINDGSYFLVVKMGIFNKTPNIPNATPSKIEKTNFRIYIGNDIIYPSYSRSSHFIDIGNSYEGGNIYPQAYDDYVFVYELTKNQVKKQYELKTLSGLKRETGKLIPSYKIITVKPIDLTQEEKLGTVSSGKEINLRDTTLLNTKYKLNSLEIKSSYTYSYEQCTTITGNCTTMNNTKVASPGKALAIIRDEIKYNEDSSYYKNSKRQFYNDFGSILYTYTLSNSGEDKEYSSDMIDVTPSGVKDVKIYEVSNMLYSAKNIRLKLQIRNKYAIIKTD